MKWIGGQHTVDVADLRHVAGDLLLRTGSRITNVENLLRRKDFKSEPDRADRLSIGRSINLESPVAGLVELYVPYIENRYYP